MRVYEDPQQGGWVIEQLRQRLSDRDMNEVHASDFWRCLRRTYLGRPESGHARALTREEIVKFAAGFAIQEWFLGPEPHGKVISDAKGRPLIFSRDGVNEDKGCVYEFKTTGKKMDLFTVDALKEQSEWLDRSRSYCAVFGMRTVVFLIYFLFQRDLKSFTVVFTDNELKQGYDEAIQRGGMLWDAFEQQKLPDATTRLSDDECVWCPYIKEFCPEQVNKVAAINRAYRAKRRR